MKSLAVTRSPFTFAAQVSGVRVRKPEEPRPKEKMKVRMIAPKISAISEDFAFDRITSSIGRPLHRCRCRGGSKPPCARPLGKLDTLKKPGDRCKEKNPGREGPAARVVSLRALDFQALSRADLRDRPAGGAFFHFLRQGEEGSRAERARSRRHLRHRAGGK